MSSTILVTGCAAFLGSHFIERLLQKVHCVVGVDKRFLGSYGSRQSLKWWGGPQSVFIDCMLNDKVIPIHEDGSQTRSFTDVSDTVDGIYEATVRSQANGEIINIGNTEEVTILELARTIARQRSVTVPNAPA